VATEVLGSQNTHFPNRDSVNPSDCEHDWKEEYYGTRCSKCGTFYAFGHEPWATDDDALAQLQAMNTQGDDLRDSGIEPLSDSPNTKVSDDAS
jgi:hypothetical protein